MTVTFHYIQGQGEGEQHTFSSPVLTSSVEKKQ